MKTCFQAGELSANATAEDFPDDSGDFSNTNSRWNFPKLHFTPVAKQVANPESNEGIAILIQEAQKQKEVDFCNLSLTKSIFFCSNT